MASFLTSNVFLLAFLSSWTIWVVCFWTESRLLCYEVRVGGEEKILMYENGPRVFVNLLLKRNWATHTLAGWLGCRDRVFYKEMLATKGDCRGAEQHFFCYEEVKLLLLGELVRGKHCSSAEVAGEQRSGRGPWA